MRVRDEKIVEALGYGKRPRAVRAATWSALMIAVAGHITVEPQQGEAYLACRLSVVGMARRADGRLDSAITADLLDPDRVNPFERWESQGPSKPSAAAARATSKARR